MNSIFRRLTTALLCIFLLLPLLPAQIALADEVETEPVETEPQETRPVNTAPAEELTDISLVTDHPGFPAMEFLFDDNPFSKGYTTTEDSSALTLEHTKGIGSLYIIFGEVYGPYTVTDNTTGQIASFGEHGFVHEFLDLEAAFGAAPTSVTVNFDMGPVHLVELYAYTSGQVPEDVQKWNDPHGSDTDLLIFPTHSDDDMLFFLGTIPYYTVERGYNVQLVYLTDHHNTNSVRIHEVLNCLWAVGMRHYPVFGEYPDFYNESRFESYSTFLYYGYSDVDLQEFVVEQLRRFKPTVILSHDFNGEYGHGQHKVYADVISRALEMSADPTIFPESAEEYGTWDVPKAYFHLYKQNQIIMDWDQPMENFDGKTPFEVCRYIGWPLHISQQYNFSWWITPFKDAKSMLYHSPREWGLYRTTVGLDKEKNDFFENVITYTDAIRLAEEARLEEERRKEEERLAAEAAATEAERLAAEAAAKAEAEAKQKAEEARRKEEERIRLEQEEAQKKAEKEAQMEALLNAQKLQIGLVLAGAAVVLVMLLVGIFLLARSLKCSIVREPEPQEAEETPEEVAEESAEEAQPEEETAREASAPENTPEAEEIPEEEALPTAEELAEEISHLLEDETE